MIPGIPYDAEVEYLESTGTQWIDTGVFPFENGNTSFEYRASTASNNRSVIVSNFCVSNTQGVISSEFGGVSNGKPFHPRGYIESTIGSVSLWGDALSPNEPVDVVVSFTALSKVLSMSVNGGMPQTMSLGRAMATAAYTLALFKDRRAVLSGFANSVRIYHMDISSGDGYVRRFIPVRFTNELAQSEGAMYDRVTKRLFRNAGTGKFAWGNDVSRPVMGLNFMRGRDFTAKDYVQDGLIAMWDGIENAGWDVHDAAATTWKDLMGERDFSLYGVGVGDNHMVFGSDSYASASPVFHSSDMMTLEVVMEVKSATSSPCYMSFFNVGSYVGDMFWYSKGCIAWGESKTATRVESACAIRGGATWGLSAHSFVRPNAPYVNGLPVGPASISEYYGSTRARGLVINPTTSWNFSGDIYSIRIYSRALASSEIAANYAVDKARFNLP